MEYMISNMHYKTLNLLSLGREKCAPLHSYSYAHTNFYLVHYVISGCGTFIKNKVPNKVNAGEIFIIKPHNVYTYIADKNNPWEYMWFSFDGEIAGLFLKCDDVIKIADDSVFYDMLKVTERKNISMLYLTGKLYEFFSELFDKEEQGSEKIDYVKMVSDYIKSNYMRRISVADIAESINLNKRYLSRIFKKEKGMTIQEYILKQKFLKAQNLLEMGFSVSETAIAVGYTDAYTFSKIFKKHIGTSPVNYKKAR